MALLPADLRSLLPLLRWLPPDLSVRGQYKGASGTVGVVGGCREYTGAPYFAARSALMVGTDLSHVFCARGAGAVIKAAADRCSSDLGVCSGEVLRESTEYEEPTFAPPPRGGLMGALAGLLRGPQHQDTGGRKKRWQEKTTRMAVEEVDKWLPRMSCLLVGPGLGRDPMLLQGVAELMLKARELGLPMLVDADGLFLVNQKPELVQVRNPSCARLPPIVPHRFGASLRTAGVRQSRTDSKSSGVLALVEDTRHTAAGHNGHQLSKPRQRTSSCEGLQQEPLAPMAPLSKTDAVCLGRMLPAVWVVSRSCARARLTS
eukprot:scaffold4409_cov369-Prasinococcus_capsulatus_cf.AAC.29